MLIQVWYANDATACGKVSDLRSWWDQISSCGPSFGSFPNTSKMWLVIKKQFRFHAVSTFQDTAVNVTSNGRPHLWAIIGSIEYSDNSVSNKVDGWISEIKTLSSGYFPALFSFCSILLWLNQLLAIYIKDYS